MIELLQDYGLLGLFIGSFMAATIIPFSSEVLLGAVLLAGVNPIAAFLVATTGNWLGGITSYFVGYLGRWDLIEKWFGVKKERLLEQKSRIDKHRSIIALFTWLPLIGDVLSIALGFYKINFLKCASFMLLGRAIRFISWILLFQLFGEQFFDYSVL